MNEAKESAARFEQARKDLEACMKIVNELFPEAGALPPRPHAVPMFPQPDSPTAQGEFVEGRDYEDRG